jgi:hypothetical protein
MKVLQRYAIGRRSPHSRDKHRQQRTKFESGLAAESQRWIGGLDIGVGHRIARERTMRFQKWMLVFHQRLLMETDSGGVTMPSISLKSSRDNLSNTNSRRDAVVAPESSEMCVTLTCPCITSSQEQRGSSTIRPPSVYTWPPPGPPNLFILVEWYSRALLHEQGRGLVDREHLSEADQEG